MRSRKVSDVNELREIEEASSHAMLDAVQGDAEGQARVTARSQLKGQLVMPLTTSGKI